MTPYGHIDAGESPSAPHARRVADALKRRDEAEAASHLAALHDVLSPSIGNHEQLGDMMLAEVNGAAGCDLGYLSAELLALARR